MLAAMGSKPKFIVTVDTETFRVAGRMLPFETHHYAELPEGTFGVQRIMDICDEYGAKATFFVDVYMHHSYGEKLVAELCQRIEKTGHDVQLHAHPSWLPGSQHALIREFSLERQVEILMEGKELIERWTGRTPKGFRAGAYGANLDTMRALYRSGFCVDSSYFPLNKNCELSQQLDNKCVNQPFYVEGILEIPVTTYWMWKGPFHAKNSKIDVNACSWAELQNVLPKFARSPLEYVVLFLHSFSFSDWDRRRERNLPRIGPLRRFENLLKLIRRELDGDFQTIGDIAQMKTLTPCSLPDFLPAIPTTHCVPRILNRFFGVQL